MGAFLFNSSEESSWGAQLEPGQNLSLMEDGLEDSALLPWTLLGLHRKEGRTRRLSGSLPKRPLATHTHTHTSTPTHSLTSWVAPASGPWVSCRKVMGMDQMLPDSQIIMAAGS